MTIDFVTDYVCPYCLLAREALEQVLEDLHVQDMEIVTHPLELTPPEKEQVDTWNDPVRRGHYREVEDARAPLGLADMKLPPHVIPRPRTRLAWEAWLFAKQYGRADLWSKCMYRAYFMHEEAIDDPALLKRYAAVLGMDANALQEAWDTHRYTDELLAMEQNARAQFEPHGVPTIWCNGVRLNIREYSRDEMAMELSRALENHETTEDGAEGPTCGPDGCA